MESLGRTLFRFSGALILGASATAVDHPGFLFAPPRLAPPLATEAPRPDVDQRRLDLKITPGDRAYAIRAALMVPQAGLPQPGSRVDIMGAIEDSQGAGRSVVKLVMYNMRLLAITTSDRDMAGRPTPPMTIATLEVTPAEAERLASLTSRATLRVFPSGWPSSGSIGDVFPADDCSPSNRGVVRDLLRRSCGAKSLRFNADPRSSPDSVRR